MKRNLLIPLIAVSIIALAGTGTMTGLFLWKNNNATNLQAELDALENDFDSLTIDHADLEEAFEDLLNISDELEIELAGMVTMIKAMPLLDKMTFYFSLCRYVCFDHSANQLMANTGADMILHASQQYNAFSEVDDILDEYDFFEFGGSMQDAWTTIENVFCVSQDGFSPAWLDCWDGTNDEADIFTWVKDHIDYTLDSVALYNRAAPFDLFLSPLEMLKYKRGDCDDFSILTATMMENNGYDTKFTIVNDNDHGDWQPDGLHHAFIFVKINPADYGGSYLWDFGEGYDWLIVDATPGWAANIGDTPSWLQWYIDNSFTDWMSVFTIAEVAAPSTMLSLSPFQEMTISCMQN